jgi:hypothetical protein
MLKKIIVNLCANASVNRFWSSRRPNELPQLEFSSKD